MTTPERWAELTDGAVPTTEDVRTFYSHGEWDVADEATARADGFDRWRARIAQDAAEAIAEYRSALPQGHELTVADLAGVVGMVLGVPEDPEPAVLGDTMDQ